VAVLCIAVVNPLVMAALDLFRCFTRPLYRYIAIQLATSRLKIQKHRNEQQ
jgi:hypothetical protein